MPRPTALGIKAAVFYSILWTAFFAAPYQNLAFAMLLFGGALGIVAFAANSRSLRHARVVGLHVPHAPAGEPRTLRLELGDAGTPLGWSLELRGAGERALLPLPLRPDRGRLWSLELDAQPRGIWTLDELALQSTHPFGLFVSRRVIAKSGEVVTPPALLDLRVEHEGKSLDEILGLPAALRGFGEPTSVRDFREGDDPKRLDWRATARRGELVVKDHEQLARPGSEVVLDRRCDEATFEESLSLVLTLARDRQERDETFTLGTQGSLATYGNDQRPWSALDRLLAELEPLPPDAPPPPSAAPETLRLPLEAEPLLEVAHA